MRATLERWARLAIWAGALGSAGMLLRTGFHEGTPGFLLFMIGAWVVAPFVLLRVAIHRSRHWPVSVREALYIIAVVVAVGALAIYIRVALVPLRAKPAVPFVAVPPAAVILATLWVGVAALMSRKKQES